ncbi:MAG: FtsX-like permease family protein [Micrococcaceae bacterium]
MRISWLLFKKSGANNRNRLMLVSAAVALGMLMVMVFITGLNALSSRSTNDTWRFKLFAQDNMAVISGVTPLRASMDSGGNLDQYQDNDINVISLYATTANSPQIPNLPTPKPGEYYVSPGLEKAIQEHPEYNIGSRFGNRDLGELPRQYVASPDSLTVIRGVTAQEASTDSFVSVYKTSGSGVKAPLLSGTSLLAIIIGGSILFTPIVVFLMIATQIGSVQREQRYATVRLIGGTRKQVTSAIAFESSMATLVGILIGTVAYFLIHPWLKNYQYSGLRFWESDIKITLSQYLCIVLSILFLSISANWQGMRKVNISPLGVARKQVRSKKPSIIRVIPLIFGLGMFLWLLGPGQDWLRKNMESVAPIGFIVMAVILVMFGLLLAGPYLTRFTSRLVASRANGATTLIATKRIETQFKPVFRSVSGVVLALFAGSFYLTATSGMDSLNADSVNGNGFSQLKRDTALVANSQLPAGFERQLQKQDYITAVQPITITNKGTAIPCAVSSEYTKLSCGEKTGYAIVNFTNKVVDKPQIVPNVTAVGDTNYIVKLKSNDDLDKLRSFVATAVPNNGSAGMSSVGEQTGSFVISGTNAQKPLINPAIRDLAALAYVGMGITLFVAIASLLISTIGGFYERKRAFATLRLGGMTEKQMDKTVLIESYIPLLSVSLLSSAVGCGVGYTFISRLTNSLSASLHPSYFMIVIGALLVAAIAIYATLPMLRTLTEPEQNRTE